jgi:hypothetical protein
MIDSNRQHGLGVHGHYCAHCLTRLGTRPRSCPGCRASFAGTGRFDLLWGELPSREFQFLFQRVPE